MPAHNLRARFAITVASLALALAACAGTDPGDPGPKEGTAASALAVTFHRDVEPILQRRCQACHTPGGIAPFSLLTYADAKPMHEVMVEKTQARIMPPWGAHDSDDCKMERPFVDDMRLTDDELRTIEAWSRDGAPEGDPKDAPPPAPPRALGVTDPSFTVQPEVGFPMSGTEDRLRCFVLDPKLAATSYVSELEVVPEQQGVVHHVLVFSDPSGESRKLADATGQYDCFGGARVQGGTLVAGWVPGAEPMRLPEGVGTPLDAGALLVMQVHYHAAGGAASPPDRTALRVKLTSSPPRLHAYTQLLGNFRGTLGDSGLMPGPNDASKAEFLIPPNVKDHTETMRVVMPPKLNGVPVTNLRLLASGAHMHYVGVKETITIERAAASPGQPAKECLLSVPRWDFDWQRSYRYALDVDALPTVNAGDRLDVRCTYDNTMGNPKLGRALRESGVSSPQPVVLGEATLDEMCLGTFTFVYAP